MYASLLCFIYFSLSCAALSCVSGLRIKKTIKMVDSANRSYLKLCVAKICQDVGFNAIQTTPLEVLTDLLQDYITALAKSAYNYALHCEY